MTTFRKILDLLTPRERKQVYLLVPLVLVMALAEVAGIASVAPFLSLLTNPDVAQTNPMLRWMYTSFGFESDRTFMLAVGVLVLVALVGSNVVLAAGNWVLAYYGAMRNHSISTRLLASYMRQPYTFFLERNSASLANNVLQEVLQVVNGIVILGLLGIAKAVAVVAILILLVVVDPVMALLVGTLLGGTYGLIYATTRRYLGRIGKERVRANHERHRAANEATGGIKDLKLLAREAEMLRRYAVPSRRFAHFQAASRVISTVPRYALEAVAFGSIVALVLVMLAGGRPVDEMLPVLGLYAFAGYRLLPALQQVFNAVAQAKYSVGALDEVHDAVMRVGAQRRKTEFAESDEVEPLPFDTGLTMRDVTYHYPSSDEPVLRGIDLDVPVRSSVAFVGTTGAGKTTLVDVILGLLTPDGGTIRVDDTVVTEANLPRWQRLIGYVPQSIFLTDDTITRNIALGLPDDRIDMDAVRRAARMAQVERFIEDELPGGYETIVGERGVRLSGGQRQRIGIARALYHDPEVLVLDEATSALDGTTERSVFEAISALAGRKTIVMIAHRLATIRTCDRIYLLDHGRVEAQGTYDELLAASPEFRRMAVDANDARATAMG